MRILIVTQYFWPENFRINDIVKFLKKKNYEVDVLTSIPNYPDGKVFHEYKENREKFNKFYGSNIYRVPTITRRSGSKIYIFLNYTSFLLSALFFGTFYTRNKDYDIIFSFATSPLSSSIPALFLSRLKNCKSYIWVLDLWPDIFWDLKFIRSKFLYKIFSYFTILIYKKFDYILAQSETFQKRIQNYTKKKVYLFPSWAEDLNLKKNKSNSRIDELKLIYKNSLKIVFTGNIGEAQNFNNVLKCILHLKEHKDILWIVVGTGRELNNIKEICFANEVNNILFEGKKTLQEVSLYHKIADILFISLKSGKAISGTIPGKLQTYLNSNKFILGFIDGETKKIIKNCKIGVTVNPNHYKKLAEKIIFLKNNPNKYKEINNKKYGSKYINRFFNRNKLFNYLNYKFTKVFDQYDQLKLIYNLKKIPFRKNFTLSGLNLAFLGYLGLNKIILRDNLYNWPDGIFYKRFFWGNNVKLNKISGRNLLYNIKIPQFIKKIYVMGNLTDNSKIFLENRLKKKIVHINLPYGNPGNMIKKFKISLTARDLIILTLPTPKQEQLADLIRKKYKFYKILCLGGAVAMASGEEIPVPSWMDKFGLEFLWRLRKETFRRSKRLFLTFGSYIFYELFSNKYNKIRRRVIL